MKLSHLSDQALLQQTLLLVKREKEILSEILLHLQEVQRRRLFCELGFGSLFQYCVKQLGYSEDQAYRRINALKMVKEMPELQEQIAQGALSLSTLSVAQSLFKIDAKVNKQEVLKALRNKSKREAEKIVREFSPKAPEKKFERRFSLHQAQEEKWQAVRAKLAHCNLSEEEILERLCDLFLTPPSNARAKARIKTNPEIQGTSQQKEHSQPAPAPAPPRSSASSPKISEHPQSAKSIPAQTRTQIKEPGKCGNCGSTYALEIDHKIPKALQVSNHPSNLRLLCRNCNQRAAIKIFGVANINKYLKH